MDKKIYDVIGIGCGPFNLGMACLTQPIEELDSLFLDKNKSFNWHPGILFEWSTLQIPFIADLVSFANPTSPYSFLNYLKEEGRLYNYYIRESFYILRSEYSDYCAWAANKLNNVRFEHEVTSIKFNEQEKVYQISGLKKAGEHFNYFTKKIILGVGTVPIVPSFCESCYDKKNVIHGSNYVYHKNNFKNEKKSITIIGSGQSAGEIYYDLLNDIDKFGYELNWVTKQNRFYPMELAKFTLEMTSPDYTDYFFDLEANKKDAIVKSQDSLYKGMNLKLISDIYDLLYIKKRNHQVKTKLIPNVAVTNVTKVEDGYQTVVHHNELDKDAQLFSEGVIVATGYEFQLPKFIDSIRSQLQFDKKGRLDINRNYSIDSQNNIFVQNVGLYTHGISVPDLGMGCYRNSIILKSIMGKEIYKIEKKIAYQDFECKC